ncbi:hypothetical protein CP8484711_2035, partial [Chlamydia psittaci 84-8471/1]
RASIHPVHGRKKSFREGFSRCFPYGTGNPYNCSLK